jgi:hypothetical protein
MPSVSFSVELSVSDEVAEFITYSNKHYKTKLMSRTDGIHEMYTKLLKQRRKK